MEKEETNETYPRDKDLPHENDDDISAAITHSIALKGNLLENIHYIRKETNSHLAHDHEDTGAERH